MMLRKIFYDDKLSKALLSAAKWLARQESKVKESVSDVVVRETYSESAGLFVWEVVIYYESELFSKKKKIT